ncbi:peptidoglycan/xylan/chitin deacetylase (PgdA/CDA1 family) [Nonomuraea polychroma]|uniref:Peptidoglycan/xylan/chitin deacetylase (PgdA/CDA1 family) n=2 Tax=Nonomuraea polychroma TaxID=46176 RepID=A0A438MKT5_9ACTN|nr:peptidoglycan/xylan/chitin deacetylase (PgdA/CDA1 family) [Nonomuraea polychroma]
MKPPYLITMLLVVTGLVTAGCAATGSTPTQEIRRTAAVHAASHHADEIATVSPTWIDGLRVVRPSGNDPTCPWSIAYPQVPGAEAFTAALRRMVEARRTDFLAQACDQADPELNLDFAFLVASGDVIGVRYTEWWLGGAGDGLSTTTRWYDAKTGTVLPATALVEPSSIGRLTADLDKALSRKEGFDAQALRAAMADSASRARYLDDLGFTAGGDLVVTFDQSVAGVAPAGQLQAVLPAAVARPLLSDLGRRVQRQVFEPTRRLDLDGRVSPTPTRPPAGPEEIADCHRVKCVALTFDDGPGPYTQTLLADLAAFRARATFYVVGQNVAMSPDVVRQTAEAGHELGNHSWSHRDLTRLTAAQVRDDLRRTDEAIRKAAGVTPNTVRPPYGAVSDVVRAQTPHPLVLWSVDTLDWKHRDAAQVTRAAVSGARPGAIILFHDIHPTTVAAIPRVLRTLSARGYHFVTVTQLRGEVSR